MSKHSELAEGIVVALREAKLLQEDFCDSAPGLIDEKLSGGRKALEQAFDEQTICKDPQKEGCFHIGCKMIAEFYKSLKVDRI